MNKEVKNNRQLIVGITGGSGAILGIRILQVLQKENITSHLVISPAAHITIAQETDWEIDRVKALADKFHDYYDIGAEIASGSFPTCGMVIAPCSIKSLSSIANCYSDNLITRSADVTLKEGRPLLLMVRETPLHPGHLHIMQLASQSGAVIFPPVPAFYSPGFSIDDMVTNIAGRALARIGIETDTYYQWQGIKSEKEPK